MVARASTPPAFGRLLALWRSRRASTQLQLAASAGTTPRHVSFLETGRSRPGRELVLRLAAALDVPLRDRNAMLVAAGLAPEYPSIALDDDRSASPLTAVLQRVLASHEPYPAWIYGTGLRILGANRAAERLFPDLGRMDPTAIIDLWFRPGPLRAMIENWPEVSTALLDTLRREVRQTADPRSTKLLRRAETLAQRASLAPTPPAADMPFACPRLRIGDRRVRTIGAVLRFDTAVEVTASELRVELMFPADEASAAFFRDAAAAG